MENSTSSVQILSSATATGYSDPQQARDVYRTFQAMGTTSAGAGAATIVIQVSNKATPTLTTDVDWITLGTISLTLGTTQTSDGFSSVGGWRWVRTKISAISGTTATVNAWMGA